MSVDRFLDTNVLLYAYDLDAPKKRAIARDILESAWLHPRTTAISAQVLQEFHVNFSRKGGSEADAANLIGDFCRWTVVENTVALLRSALEVKERWRLSLWDSLVVAAAHSCGADELLTEDLNDGQDYGGVRVVNPFTPS